MGASNVELVDRYTQTLEAGDFESALAMLDPEVVFVEPQGLPHSGEWRGPQGIAELGGTIQAHWAFEVERREAFDAGDRVLVEVLVRFTSLRSGASCLMPIVEIYRVRDGLIYENQIYYQDVPALAGLHDAGAA